MYIKLPGTKTYSKTYNSSKRIENIHVIVQYGIAGWQIWLSPTQRGNQIPSILWLCDLQVHIVCQLLEEERKKNTTASSEHTNGAHLFCSAFT